jgi:glycosyltransferase involved in cell wall biosynthesis
LRDIIKVTEQVIADINCHCRIIAVSQATREFHVRQGLNADRCVVIHNGVDLAKFYPGEPTGYLQRERGLPSSAKFIATIGQIGLRKGMDVVLRAAQEVAAQKNDVHWLIVGERTSEKAEAIEFEQRLRDLAMVPPLIDRVHFLGQRNDVVELLGECTILVHAARQEPLSRVLLEAAASGVPIVAADVGGTREIFPLEADGAILVPADDPAALAEAMASLLFDANRREVLSRAARRRAETAFDVRTAVAKLIDEYRAVLASA